MGRNRYRKWASEEAYICQRADACFVWVTYTESTSKQLEILLRRPRGLLTSTNYITSGGGMEVRPLEGDGRLTNAVKRLNLGVLPVQPPLSCYKKAEKGPFSFAVLEFDENHLSEENARVVGGIIADFEAPMQSVCIRTLAVAAACRRQGIGRQLVQHVLDRVRFLQETQGLGAKKCTLHVHTANEDGIAFYQSMGFQESARLDNYYRRLDPPSALVMSYSFE